MKKLFKKFFQIEREKGTIYALIKTYDYLNFLYKKRKTKRKFVYHKDKISLVLDGFSLNIYWEGYPLTANIGFHSEVFNLETWHDTTQANWDVEINEKMKINIRFWNLPLRQIWSFNIEENYIFWNIKMEVEEYLFLEEIKAGILVLPNYKIWMTPTRGGKFPPINNFEKIDINDDEKLIFLCEEGPLEIGNVDVSQIYLPSIVFQILPAEFSSFPILQNANRYINGRYLQAQIKSPQEYLPGYYNIFSFKIYIDKDYKKLSQIMSFCP